MPKSLTIDELYEAYMDIGEWGAEGEYGSQEFAFDVYDWFGADVTGKGKEQWAAEYGMYLPSYDPTAANLAAQERELDYRDAENVYSLAKDISNQVYATAVGDVSASVATDFDKSRQIAGGLGLRSGGLKSATTEALKSSQNKVEALGDSLRLKQTEDQNTYNNVMADSTLDYDKALHQTKSEFYDRTLAMINKLTDIGAFTEAEDPCPGEKQCIDGSCGGSIGCGCPENADDPTCVGTGDQPPGNEGIADSEYCTQICTPYAGMEAGGMTCYDSCLGTPTMGGGEFDPHIIDWQDRAELENEMGCVPEWDFASASYQCPGGTGDGSYDVCIYGTDLYGNPC